MIAVLDALEPDPDLEDGADAEPSLGWPEHRGIAQHDKSMSHDDREEENEHGGDVCDEPHDAADCGDDEPNLGSRELCSQWKDMQALGFIDMDATDPNDTDGISIMGGIPLDFRGDGNTIAKADAPVSGRIAFCRACRLSAQIELPDTKNGRARELSPRGAPTLSGENNGDGEGEKEIQIAKSS